MKENERFKWGGGYTIDGCDEERVTAEMDELDITYDPTEMVGEDAMEYKLSGTKEALLRFLTANGFNETDVTDYLTEESSE